MSQPPEYPPSGGHDQGGYGGQPPGYGGARLSLPPMPDELVPQINAWRTTPAGQLAMRVYRDHRAAAAAPREVGSRGGAKLVRD